jgi:hypothetical protein
MAEQKGPGEHDATTVKHPTGSNPDDQAFEQAYPFGTYGHGPKGKAEGPAELPGEAGAVPADQASLEDGKGRSPLSPLIDHERPETSLEKAQRGKPADRTGTR